MKRKIERKRILKIGVLAVFGFFIVIILTTTAIGLGPIQQWDGAGNTANPAVGDQLGTYNNADLVIVAGGNGMPAGGTQRMVVNWNTGNVGIGLAGTPFAPPIASARLHVDLTTNPAPNTYLEIARIGDITVPVSKAVGIGVYDIGGDPAIQAIDQSNPTDYTIPLYINPKGSNTYLNTEAGVVGIRTNNPQYHLHIGDGTQSYYMLIEGTSMGRIGANIYGLELYSATRDKDIVFFTNPDGSKAERVRIKNSGNVGIGYIDPGTAKLAINGKVGIGTTSPDKKLDILDSSGPQLRLTYTDGSVYTDFETTSSGNLYIKPTGGSYSGRVGIGTNTPGSRLHVDAGSSEGLYAKTTGAGWVHAVLGDATNGGVGVRGDSTTGYGVHGRATTGRAFYAYVSDSSGYAIYAQGGKSYLSGNVGIGTTSPDEELDVNGAICIKDGMSIPSTHSGKGTIFIDSADGDLKIKFGDGTVKTIVAD